MLVRTATITWSAAANASSYELYVDNATTGQVSDLTKLTGTSYTPTSNLTAGNYDVYVRASTLPARQAPGAAHRNLYVLGSLPGLSVVTGPGAGIAGLTPTITWEAAINASTYELYVDNTTTGQVSDLTKLTGTSYTPTSNLAAGNNKRGCPRSTLSTASRLERRETFTLRVRSLDRPR